MHVLKRRDIRKNIVALFFVKNHY